jgi:hypothetical protein
MLYGRTILVSGQSMGVTGFAVTREGGAWGTETLWVYTVSGPWNRCVATRHCSSLHIGTRAHRLRQNARMLIRVWIGVRAAVTGVLVTFFIRLATEQLMPALRAWTPPGFLGQWFVGSMLPAAIPAAGAVGSGLAVGWLFREHRRLAVGSYLGFVLLLSAPRGYQLVANALTEGRYVPALLGYVMNLAIVTGAIVVGGFATRRGALSTLVEAGDAPLAASRPPGID